MFSLRVTLILPTRVLTHYPFTRHCARRNIVYEHSALANRHVLNMIVRGVPGFMCLFYMDTPALLFNKECQCKILLQHSTWISRTASSLASRLSKPRSERNSALIKCTIIHGS